MEGGMSGCIIGWAHSKFGNHEGRDIESLIVEVTEAALADAGVMAADIDTVYLGTMNGGFVRQEFPASLVFQADPGFRFKPATRVEDACATGSAAPVWRSSSASRRCPRSPAPRSATFCSAPATAKRRTRSKAALPGFSERS